MDATCTLPNHLAFPWLSSGGTQALESLGTYQPIRKLEQLAF